MSPSSFTKSQITQWLKNEAATARFDFCGIAKAQYLEDDARRLEKWISKGMHGSMQYMENHFELRVDPTKLVPGAKSVITLLLNQLEATIQIALIIIQIP